LSSFGEENKKLLLTLLRGLAEVNLRLYSLDTIFKVTTLTWELSIPKNEAKLRENPQNPRPLPTLLTTITALRPRNRKEKPMESPTVMTESPNRRSRILDQNPKNVHRRLLSLSFHHKKEKLYFPIFNIFTFDLSKNVTLF
jgi:hypothetical protein